MNNKLLILAIILIVTSVIYLINFLKVKNTENFSSSLQRQQATTSTIKSTMEQSDENNSKITKTGEDLEARKNIYISNYKKQMIIYNKTKKVLKKLLKVLMF